MGDFKALSSDGKIGEMDNAMPGNSLALFCATQPPLHYPERKAANLTPEYIATLRRKICTRRFSCTGGARKLKAARLRQLPPAWTEKQVQQRVKEIFMHAVT